MDLEFSDPQLLAGARCVLSVPPGWSPVQRDGALLAVVSNGSQDTFRANVVVTAVQHQGPAELSWLAEGVRRRLRELAQVRFAADKPVTVDGVDGHLFRVSYRHPTAGTLVQAVLTMPIAYGPEVHVMDVVGTFGADRIADDAVTVDAVMRSVRIGVSD